MVSVMLVDDHTMFREGLRRSFEECDDIEIVGEAGTAEELMKKLPRNKPNVVILDIKLPDIDGPALIQNIKSVSPASKVVILTMYNHSRYALHALQNGANGYVLKGSPFANLLQAVKTVCQGKTFICPEVAPELISRLKQPSKGGSLDNLSPREFEVLTLLGAGLSLKEIGARLGIGEKTVGTYRVRIMTKLHLSNKADLFRIALEAGVIE
jgi:DNA-binding NarL/FixJ family response regulator